MIKRLMLALAVLVAACGAGESPQPELESEAAPTQGREQTQAIRGVGIPGHDSNAIADQVDATLNEAEERKRRYEQEADGEPEGTPE